MNKPPLGVKPYFVSATDRIEELSKAIYDYSQETSRTSLIKRWASEIILQCELIEKTQEMEKKQNEN